MYRILVSDKLGAAALERLKEHADMSVDVKTGLSKEQLLEVIPEYDGLIVRSGTQVTADVLAAGKKLRAHCAVEDQDALGCESLNQCSGVGHGAVFLRSAGVFWANALTTSK